MRKLILTFLSIAVLGMLSNYVFAVIAAKKTYKLVTDTFDLAGVPAPYRFHKFQALATGERIGVGGNGDFLYNPNPPEPVYRGKVANANLNGVYFINPKAGWVVGDQGSIYKTNDRGISWTKQKSGVKSDLFSISCVGGDQCWVVGDDGVILSTQNGRDWKPIDSGVNTSLYAVDFLDEGVGVAVGKNALVLRTDDGGVRWRKQLILGGEGSCNGRPFASDGSDLYAVRVFDSETAWVAGIYGIARYSKALESWEGLCVCDVGPIVGIVSQDGKKVFAIGSAGLNAVSVDSGKLWDL